MAIFILELDKRLLSEFWLKLWSEKLPFPNGNG